MKDKPDYSGIKEMAYECKSPEERKEIIGQLEEWGVPISSPILSDELFILWYDDFILTTFHDQSDLKDTKAESGLSFLAPFEKIWKEWNEANAAPEPKQLIVPSDEEIETYCNKVQRENYGDYGTLVIVCNWMRGEIIRLNK